MSTSLEKVFAVLAGFSGTGTGQNLQYPLTYTPDTALDWNPFDSPADGDGVLHRALLSSLWHRIYEPSMYFTGTYMKFYFEQLKSYQTYLNISTHRELLEIISFVREKRQMTRIQIEDLLKQNHAQKLGRPENSAKKVSGLVIGLWLMLEGRDWADDQSLDQFVADSMPVKAQQAEHWISKRRPSRNKRDSPYYVPSNFNMNILDKIGGISVRWTNLLSEHLNYDPEAGELVLFAFTPFLDGFEGPNDMFPKDLLDETQRTYSLLFPDIPECRGYNSKIKADNPDMEQAFQRRTAREFAARDLRDFPYWQDQLLALKEGFDATKPSGFWRWWRDRRDKVTWATFWTAALVLALTVVFGVIGSMTSIMQTWKAYHP